MCQFQNIVPKSAKDFFGIDYDNNDNDKIDKEITEWRGISRAFSLVGVQRLRVHLPLLVFPKGASVFELTAQHHGEGCRVWV